MLYVATLLGSLVAYRDEEANTIRHVNCQYLLKSVSSGNRCNSCVTFRNNKLRRELNHMRERVMKPEIQQALSVAQIINSLLLQRGTSECNAYIVVLAKTSH